MEMHALPDSAHMLCLIIYAGGFQSEPVTLQPELDFQSQINAVIHIFRPIGIVLYAKLLRYSGCRHNYFELVSGSVIKFQSLCIFLPVLKQRQRVLVSDKALDGIE